MKKTPILSICAYQSISPPQRKHHKSMEIYPITIHSISSHLISSHNFHISFLPPPSSTTQNPSCQRLPPSFRTLLIERSRIPSFRPIHTFLTRRLTHPSQQAAFTELSTYSLRHSILNGINVFIAGDFGGFEFIYILHIYIYISIFFS